MPVELALLALLLAAYALVAGKLERFSIGPAMVFVAIGLLLSDDTLGPISLEPGTEAVRLIAEAALALLLFADAAQVPSRALRHDAAPIARLLFIGLPLTILLGTLGATFLFPGISIGLALLVGSALAPTDAALGQPVVTNTAVPARIRRLLNVESGLNDGIATPVVFFAVTLASAEMTGHSGWLGDAFVDSMIGLTVGLVLGFGGGKLLDIAKRNGWTSHASGQLFVLALAAGSYLASLALGGNGFVAAFVGGLAFGAGKKGEEAKAVRFTEIQGSLLAIGVWTSFGLLLAGEFGAHLFDLRPIAYAVLSLTLFRMLPVALALVGAGFRRDTVLFMGWFGPRGLASIVFLIIGLDGLSEAGVAAGELISTVAWTVLFSVVLHGISAGPLAVRYGRRARELPSDAAELSDSVEVPAPRRIWPVESGA